MEISVRELKNHLSEYLRRAQAGERIIVTSRGKPVASLTAADRLVTPVSREEALQRLEGMPWIIPAKKRGGTIGAGRSVEVPDGTVDEIMDWVRGR